MLLECARRILPASNGPVEASNDLVAEHLTDWLIVLASDAVKAAVAESAQQVSGKAELRLMAWLLCDACGHEGAVLEKARMLRLLASGCSDRPTACTKRRSWQRSGH